MHELRIPARGAAWALCAALAFSVGAPALAAESVNLTVEVEGIEDELRENVLARLEIAQAEDLSEAELRDLHQRAEAQIRRALEPFGHYRPVIAAELTHEDGRWRARYRIDPGDAIRIDSLDVRVTGEGESDPTFQRALAGLPLRGGAALVHPEYEQSKTALTTVAARGGFLDARFRRHEIVVDLERYRAAVFLVMETGPRYYFGPVEFRQDVVDPELLQGYVTFEPGQPLDYNELLELERALGSSPYFSRVEVRPRRDLAIGNRLPIVVDLVPAKPERYTVGIGYGTDSGPLAHGTVEFRRLNRRGHRAQIEGTFATRERTGGARYQIPWPYPRTDLLTLAGGYTVIETETSFERTGLLGASWARLWAGWNQTVALHFRRERFDVGVDRGLASFLIPEASWDRLRSNDPIDPTDGHRLIFRISGASTALLSDATYARPEAHAKWLRTFGRRNLLSGRLEAGYVWTEAFRELPPSARFFAGGAESVRGFGYHSLGRRDEAGNVIGGEMLAVGSIEYEYRFLEGWGAAAFYDAGNAMSDLSGPLEQGAGFGIRWRSPVGVVRVDLGFPLTGEHHRPEFHLSIGPGL